MKKKMSLIESVDYYSWPMGGTLTYVLNIIPKLNEKFDLTLWGVSVKGKEDNVKEEIRNIPVYRYANIKKNKKIIPNSIRVFCGAWKNAKKLENQDIIFCHSATELIAIKMRLGKKINFVAYIQHGLSFLTTNRIFIKMFNIITSYLAMRIANIVFIVSDNESFENYVKDKKSKDKFYNVGSPVQIDLIKEKSKIGDDIKFVYTGRLSKEKRIDVAIRAFAEYIKSSNRECTFTIIGDGELKSQLEELVSSMNIKEYVIFYGQVEHTSVMKMLGDYDIFLMPTKGEGASLSTIEAMAAGLPVIAFNVTGMRGLIFDDYNGAIVEDNSIDEYVNGMIKVTENIQKLSENAKTCAQKYSSEEIAEYMSNSILYEYSKKR